MKRLKAVGERMKKELEVYRRILTDKRTPKLAKFLLGAAVAYAVSPIDLIPDFIPVLGQLDDMVIVPMLVYIALKLVPKTLQAEARHAVEHLRTGSPGATRLRNKPHSL